VSISYIMPNSTRSCEMIKKLNPSRSPEGNRKSNKPFSECCDLFDLLPPRRVCSELRDLDLNNAPTPRPLVAPVTPPPPLPPRPMNLLRMEMTLNSLLSTSSLRPSTCKWRQKIPKKLDKKWNRCQVHATPTLYSPGGSSNLQSHALAGVWRHKYPLPLRVTLDRRSVWAKWHLNSSSGLRRVQ